MPKVTKSPNDDESFLDETFLHRLSCGGGSRQIAYLDPLSSNREFSSSFSRIPTISIGGEAKDGLTTMNKLTSTLGREETFAFTHESLPLPLARASTVAWARVVKVFVSMEEVILNCLDFLVFFIF